MLTNGKKLSFSSTHVDAQHRESFETPMNIQEKSKSSISCMQNKPTPNALPCRYKSDYLDDSQTINFVGVWFCEQANPPKKWITGGLYPLPCYTTFAHRQACFFYYGLSWEVSLESPSTNPRRLWHLYVCLLTPPRVAYRWRSPIGGHQVRTLKGLPTVGVAYHPPHCCTLRIFWPKKNNGGGYNSAGCSWGGHGICCVFSR